MGSTPTPHECSLLSTTHGAETTGLAAYLAVSKAYAERDVVAEMELQGTKLRSGLEQVAKECGMEEHVIFMGRPSCLVFVTKDHNGQPSQAFRTLFIQELLRRGVLGQSLVISAAHTDADIDQTIEAAAGALEVYARAIEAGSTDGLLVGRPVAPALREFAEPRRLTAGFHDSNGRRSMKVVLFCGGLGMRMRSGSDAPVPKPMMPIGTRPVLWHIMRYYAHFGHNEFILCLGFGAHSVKDYFLNYHETHSNDFVLSDAGRTVELLSSDISDWRITFADTGFETPIGERLRRVRDYLGDDEVFLANYGDVLTNAPMNDLVDDFLQTDAVGSLLAVPPQDSFHVVGIDGDSRLTGIEAVADMDMRINGGYFILRKEIFDYLQPGDDLVTDTFMRAARAGRFRAVRFDGFWAPMDTLKERAALDAMHRNGNRPWALWETSSASEFVARPSVRTLPVPTDSFDVA